MTDFNTRLKEARAKALASNGDTRLKSDIAINDALKRESIKTLTTIIHAVADELNLDKEKLDRKIQLARRSNYGRICEMISIIASIYAWPISENTQASEIPELQERMLDTLSTLNISVDSDLLLDMKEAKGFNSFMDMSTYTIVPAVEPIYDELEYYYLTFAEEASLPIIDYKMTEAIFNRAEEKALNRIQIEQDASNEALARFEAMTKMGQETTVA